MRIKIRQLLLPLDYEEKDILKTAAAKLGCNESLISGFRLIRRSIDARSRREAPVFSLTIKLDLINDGNLSLSNSMDVEILHGQETFTATPAIIAAGKKPAPVVVGAGPSGLMAALTLAEAGLSPLLIERGPQVNKRTSEVSLFWKKGVLNPEGNILFGEGGAGLFSDGKLTTRSKDRLRVRHFLETLVKCGAPEDILIDAEPHLGSDLLKKIVPVFRNLIEKKGGEVQFDSRFEGIHVDKNRLRGIIVNGKEIETESCVLATGHSARDVYKILAESGVMMEQKAFAVGLRLEIPQKFIDISQWGTFAGHPRLGAAGFRLTFKKDGNSRACYTFCMCPGGTVIPCASSRGSLTTNGMSLSARSGPFGNAAFLVPVDPSDYLADYPEANGIYPSLSGIEFQDKIENLAYVAGGSDFSIPAASLSGFLKNRYPDILPEKRSWPRSRPADLHLILPGFVCNTLSVAIPRMLRLLEGVSPEEALLYAPETRSSSPVRISRKENGESMTVSGLFPSGEGAGYAGGIVSSAVDGLRAAEAVINKGT